eukprot:225287_1
MSGTHENGYLWVIDLAFDLTIILGTSYLADLANTSSHYQGRYGMYTSDTDIVYEVGPKQEASDMLYDICSPHDGEDHDDLYEDDEEYYEGLDRDHTLRGRALYEKPSDAVLHLFIAVCEQISSTDTAYYPDLQKWQMEEKLIEMIEQMQELMQTVDVVKEMDQYKTLKQEIENQGDIWSMGVKLYCILQEMNAQLRTSVNGIDEVSAPCKELWQNRSDECKEEKEAAKEDKALANVAKNDTQSAIFNGSNVATVEGSNVANNAANAVGFKVAIAQCEEEEEASYKDSNKKYADEEKVKKITNGVRENGDKIAKSQEYVLVFDPDSISDERVNIHSDDHRHMNDIYWREEEKEFEEECYLMPQPLVEDRSDEAHEDIDPDYDPKDDKLQGIKDAEEDEEEPESITKSGDTDNEKDVVHADDFEKEFNEAIEIDENVLRVARMDREATLPNVRKEYERETAQESTDQMIGDAFKTFNICGTEETQNDEDEKGDVDPQQFGKGFEEALQNVRDVAKVDQELLANASCNIYSDLCDEEPDAKQLSETLGAVKDGLADEAREEFVELYQVVQDDDSDSDYDEDDEEKSDTGSSDESEDEQTLRSQPDEEEIGEIDINTSESRKEFEVALTVVRDVVKLDRELLVNGICSCYNDLVDDELDVEQLSHMFDVVKREFTEEGRDHFKSDEDHKDIDSIDNKLCGHCDNAAHLLENENRDARHPYVKVNTIGEDQSSILESLIESKLDDVIIIAHDLNLCFASCDTYGVFGQELVDFGLQFGCIDLTGESAAQRTKSVVQVLSLTQQITHLRTQNSAKQRRREMTEEEREKAMVQQQTLNAKIGNTYNDLCEQDVQRSSEVSSESISHTQNDDYIEKGKASRDFVMDLGTFALRVRCINHGSKRDDDHYLINYVYVAPTNGANVRSSGHDAKVDTQVVMKGVRNTKVMLRDMNSMRLDELLHCVGLNTSRCELYELIQSALKEQKVDVTLTDPISAAVVPRIAYPQALSNTKYYLLRSKAIKSPSHLSVIEEIYDSAVDERDLAHERQCDMRLEQIEAGYQVLSTGQINIQKMHHELKLQDQQIHEQSQLQQELVDVKQKVVMDRVDAAPSDTNKHEEDIELKQSEIDDDDEYNLKDEEDLHIEFAMKNAKYGSNYSHHEEDAVFSMRAHTSSAYEVFGGKLNRLFEEMPRTYDAMSNNAHLIEVIGLIYDVGFMIDFAENNSSKEVIDLLHDVRSQHVDFFGTSERIEFSTENVNYFEHSMEITEVENATGLDSTQAWILYEVIVDSLAMTFVFLTLFVYNRMTEYVLCHEEEELLLKGVGMIKSDVIDHTTDDNEDGERHMIVGRIYATIITGTNHYEGSACVPRYEVGDISPLDLSTDVVESFDIASVNEKEAMRCMHAKPQFETDEMVTDDDEYPKEYEEQRIKDNTKEKEMEDLAGIRMIKTDAKHATVYEGLTNHMELTYYLCVVEHCQDMTEVGVNSLGIALLDKIAMDHYYDTIVLEKNEEETDLQFTTMAFISALVMIIVRLFEATDHEEEKYDGIERDESDEDLFADNLLCLSDHEGNLLWHDIGSTYTDCEYNYIYGYSYEHVPRHFVSEDIVDYVCHSSRTKQHRCADDEVFLFKYYHKIQCADTEFNCNEYNDTMEEDVLRLNREKLKDIEENFFEDLASVRSTHSLCDWVKNTSSDVTLCRVRCRPLGVILTYIELIQAFEISRCILISKRATCTLEFIRLIATFDEQLLEIASGTRHGFDDDALNCMQALDKHPIDNEKGVNNEEDRQSLTEEEQNGAEIDRIDHIVRAEIDSIVSDLELKSKLLFE